MGMILSMQLSAFSNKRIVPSTDNIAILMPKLKELSGDDLLPSILNTQKIDISTGNIENVPNLSFSTINNKEKIVCTENRIDCTFNFEAEEQTTVLQDFQAAIKILQFIMEIGNVFANRLALNVDFTSDVCNGNTKFEKQVMHKVPFYQNKEIKEWSSRTNARGTMEIHGKEELNIITEYNHIAQKEISENRIVCHSDINTIQENKDYRFTFSDIEYFATHAIEIFVSIQSDLENMVKQ